MATRDSNSEKMGWVVGAVARSLCDSYASYTRERINLSNNTFRLTILFTQRNFVADFLQVKCDFTLKTTV